MAKKLKVWTGSIWDDVAVQLPDMTAFAVKASPVLSDASLTGITSIEEVFERVNISTTAATGTINFDFVPNFGVTFLTSSAAANWTLNVRGSSTQTLNSLLSVGQAITIVLMNTNGATAYYQTGFQIDGTTTTVRWQGGSAPTSGNANSIDAYSFTIIKTASATYTVLGSLTRFA